MSGEDSGVDAGSNASDDSIGMSLASSDSDYDRDNDFNHNLNNNNNDNEDIVVIDVNINPVIDNNNGNNANDSGDNCPQNDFEQNCCETRMYSMPTSSMASMVSMATTSSSASQSLMSLPSSSSHCHYDSLCSTSTSGSNRLFNAFDNRLDHNFETKPDTDLIGVPNDYHYKSEEQHEFCPKMRSIRQKTHEMKRKHMSKDMAGERLLRRAANSNDLECVERLLNEGIDPQSCDERSRTALHFAACKGNTQIARLLLDSGANPNQKDIVGNTALHLAACTNNIEVITLLLSAGTDVHSLDNSGRTPLHLAQSKLKMIQSMQRSDANINSNQLKSEVLQVLQMMSIYWHRSGKNAELELLTTFTNRLHLSQTTEEVGIDVKDLLTSLSHLTL